MLTILALTALATGLAAPAPLSRERPPISNRDYPERAAARGEQGGVVFQLIIDTEGKPVRCAIEQVVGTDFSTTFCRLLMGGRYQPATDRQGQAIAGIWRSATSFFQPQRPSPIRYPLVKPPDLQIRRHHVSAAEQVPELKLIVQIDAAGTVVDCAPADAAMATLAATVCTTLASGAWHDPARPQASDGITTYVRELKVGFIYGDP